MKAEKLPTVAMEKHVWVGLPPSQTLGVGQGSWQDEAHLAPQPSHLGRGPTCS